MRVAVVGATGLVGSKILQVLAERDFPVSELIPVASEKSVGKKVHFKGKAHEVVNWQQALERKPRVAIFSAGGATSKELAPRFAEVGCTVIDNSSAWRMEPHIPLVVPEVNAHVLKPTDKIIANPNCSTIQMVVVLKPLHDRYRIKRVVVSTYQSVTGTGKKAVDQLMRERRAAVGKMLQDEKILPAEITLSAEGEMAYAYPIDLNAIPHIDVFLENGYTKEEMKMVNETKKIMGDENIRVTATTVRIPTIGGHSESVNVEFENDFDLDEVRALLARAPGVIVADDVKSLTYPMPLYAHDKDETFVGRLRRDESQPRTLNCWIVSDNLRKGAATNAVQIAEYLLKNGMLS
ncbi:MAG: aspartate-semialdehyde dehydrogenase [Chitinophagales bacterium]|nr:aspartate-semialdehyde dehydrogenase [Chitinophagales bacterium]MDW8418287.1 aspartate-semialdehyde dehydrogenase [Chitinophagales bacterium]